MSVRHIAVGGSNISGVATHHLIRTRTLRRQLIDEMRQKAGKSEGKLSIILRYIAK